MPDPDALARHQHPHYIEAIRLRRPAVTIDPDPGRPAQLPLLPPVDGLDWIITSPVVGSDSKSQGVIVGDLSLSILGRLLNPYGLDTSTTQDQEVHLVNAQHLLLYSSAWGVMLAGLFYGLIEALVTAFAGSTYTQIIAFTVVILALAAMPNGLLGRAAAKKV